MIKVLSLCRVVLPGSTLAQPFPSREEDEERRRKEKEQEAWEAAQGGRMAVLAKANPFMVDDFTNFMPAELL